MSWAFQHLGSLHDSLQPKQWETWAISATPWLEAQCPAPLRGLMASCHTCVKICPEDRRVCVGQTLPRWLYAWALLLTMWANSCNYSLKLGCAPVLPSGKKQILAAGYSKGDMLSIASGQAEQIISSFSGHWAIIIREVSNYIASSHVDRGLQWYLPSLNPQVWPLPLPLEPFVCHLHQAFCSLVLGTRQTGTRQHNTCTQSGEHPFSKRVGGGQANPWLRQHNG